MKWFISAVSLLLLFPFSSCDDDVIEALPSRYVYFVDAAGSAQRYDITLKKIEAVGIDQVEYVTSVAENGIVLFETVPGGIARLWGRCQDGSIIPVPMPVAANAGEEYVYGHARAALSASGHHAAWTVYRRPNGSADSTEWIQEICRFDCGAWNMEQIDVSSWLVSAFQGSGFGPDIVRVRDVLISNDGGRVVLSIEVTDVLGQFTRKFQYMLLVWENDSLRLLQGRQQAMDLLAFDTQCRTLYFTSAGSHFAVDCGEGALRSVAFPTGRKELLSTHACSRATGEFISTITDGEILVLTRIEDGSRSVVLPNIREITMAYPEINYGLLGPWFSISPDGEWIVFPWVVDADTHLFVIHRDGKDLHRIAQGTFHVQPVVSDEIPL
ncbi:MAG: hypothetical protein JXA28_09770 [Bacteroidetes bacterium]|nr:hypothetical protein [Bacteroidota bacterium]